MDFTGFDTIYLVLILMSASMAVYAIGLTFSKRPWPWYHSAIALALSLFWFDQASTFPEKFAPVIAVMGIIGLGFVKPRSWALKILCLNVALIIIFDITISTYNGHVAMLETRIWADFIIIVFGSIMTMLISTIVYWSLDRR